jgi:hypothetical protein
MTDIILHHYETSPYSEKVRLGQLIMRELEAAAPMVKKV